MSSGPVSHVRAAGMNSAFGAALLDPDIAIPDGISGPDGGAAPKRFGVYRNNVVVGLMDALAAAFPSVAAIMGEENFARVTRNFIAMHPPRSPVMQLYGEDFPLFLQGFAPLRGAPYLADVASAERAFLNAWHAADAPALDGAEIGALDPAQTAELRFACHPATRLLMSDFPVADLFSWRHGRPDSGIDLGICQGLLVTRPVFDVAVTALTRPQHNFLDQLCAGRSFAEAAEAALEKNRAFDIAGTFAIALGAGMFLPLNFHAKEPE